METLTLQGKSVPLGKTFEWEGHQLKMQWLQIGKSSITWTTTMVCL